MKRLVNGALALAGLELRRRPKTVTARCSMRGVLEHVRRLGFWPRVVIDVGAADGTPALYETYPDAKHILIEPLAEFSASLDLLASGYQDMKHLVAVAGPKQGTITLNVHPDLYGSSVYTEGNGSIANGASRSVGMIPLDDICPDYGPILLKIDAQGSELDVLAGAARVVLKHTELAIIETSTIRFFVDGGGTLLDLARHMGDRGFVLYDLFGLHYRPLDGALAQVDAVFVPESSQLLTNKSYATEEQYQRMYERRATSA